MDQSNTATPDELQQAINSITNPGGGAAANDAVASVEQSVAAEAGIDLGTPPTPEIPGLDSVQATPSTMPMPGMSDVAAASVSGDSDLGRVKTMALSDLRPLIDKVEMEPSKKFSIYKEIIETTDDKACIEPAYNIAKTLTDERERAEALLFIIETIDKAA